MAIIKGLAFLLCVGASYSQMPIPPRPDGFRYNGYATSPIQLEIFVDPLCPDSRAAWPNMQAVARHYSDKVSVLVHTFPLPYHRYSFAASQAIVGLGKGQGAGAFFGLLEAFFKHQEAFGNRPTQNSTTTDVYQTMAALAPQIRASPQQILAALSNGDYDQATRISWKYGTTRGVSGTPIFLVNGVAVDADADWGVEQWREVVDPLLAQS